MYKPRALSDGLGSIGFNNHLVFQESLRESLRDTSGAEESRSAQTLHQNP